MDDWRKLLDEHIEGNALRLRDVRRHLHVHPELSGQELETTRYLAEALRLAGLEPRLAPSGRGLMADGGSGGGPLVVLRADIDALPLHDAKAVGYRSAREGVTHACGHDAHAAMLLGAALALHGCREYLPEGVRWRALFQPAEEIGQGALEMIAAGAVEGARAIVGLHVDPERALGRVGVRHGVVTAANEELYVTIYGEGGHAARPHHTVDPIALATQFINAVYQLIPRSVDPRDPAVVSFGMIRGGSAGNIIPDEVQIRGTVRSLSEPTAVLIRERIRTIANGLCQAGRGRCELRFVPATASVVNDPEVTEVCSRAAQEVVGGAQIESIPLPSMGAEDFSAYLSFVPGCLLRLGVAGEVHSRHFLHSPLFDIDERALPIGAKVLSRSAVLLSLL